jgi:ribokinase
MGSATMDAFIETEKNTASMQIVDGKERPFITYQSGEKVLISHLQFEVGGGGTNTAVCFARLGLRTAYLGNIGADVNGQQVQQNLKSEKVDFIGTTSEHLTNYSIVLESALLHDRTILVYKGASEHFSKTRLPSLACKWLYLSSLAGESFEAAEVAVGECKAQGIKVAFNPSNYQIEHNKDEVIRILQKAHAAIMNRDEAVLLVGEGTDRELLERIRKHGPTIVAVTMGARGIAVTDGVDWLRTYPTPNLHVRETTGAGDCFASSFVAGLVYEKPLDETLRWALVNVENHIQHVGAKAGLLTKTELQFAVLQDSRAIYSL